VVSFLDNWCWGRGREGRSDANWLRVDAAPTSGKGAEKEEKMDIE